MNILKYSDFEIAACQAIIFTPEEELSTGRIIRDLYPKWAELFDDDPVILPPGPGFPPEVPRIILKNKDDYWRLEIASGRSNFFWRKREGQQDIHLEEFYQKSCQLFCEYQVLTGCRIGRLAAVLTRFAEHDSPGLFLARHFCQDRWEQTPMNRPENFELHAHKRFSLEHEFSVNSWARSKTGRLTIQDAATAIVLFEQDINTLSEEAKTKSFKAKEIKRFFGFVVPEFDSILRLYYP